MVNQAALNSAATAARRIDTAIPIGYGDHMRALAAVGTWLSLTLLCAAVSAEEVSDRSAIVRTIAALNILPQPSGIFTAGTDAGLVIDELSKGRRIAVGPTLTISHEPWGEATLNIPGMGTISAAEIRNPRIESGNIRFIAADVALVDGTWTLGDSAGDESAPLLFVMKKEDTVWKIAAVIVKAR